MRHQTKGEKGFTLIETMISIVIFALISMALFSMFSSILQSVRRNKALLAANGIITEEMETIRGMRFDDVATAQGFVPPGKLVNEKQATRSGMAFTIRTDVTWVDDHADGWAADPATGTPASPSPDFIPWDYKKVRISVLWKDPTTGSSQESAASTNVVPEGLEGLDEGKGGIYVTVFNSAGVGVGEANVDVSSAKAHYTLDDAKTDNNGNLWISQLAPADDYRVEVSKAGYSSERTYAINDHTSDPEYNPNPVKRDLRVVAQEVTRAGFAIDALGSMNIKTVHFSAMSNFRGNANRAGQQSDPSAVLVPGTDAAHPDLLVAFTDTRDGDEHIFQEKLHFEAATSTYSTRMWANDFRTTNWANAGNPILKRSPKDGTVFLLWNDERCDAPTVPLTTNVCGSSEVWLKRINPATGAIVGSYYSVDHAAAANNHMNASMDIDQDGNVYIVWEDNRDGTWDIYMQKFNPATNTFLPADIKVNTLDADEQLNPRVVVDKDMSGTSNANNVYVVWQSNHSGNFDVYMRKFNNTPAALFAERKVNSDSGNLDQYEPDLTYDGTAYLYVAWTDERNSEPDIYLQKLDKNGNAVFAGGDVLVNDDAFAAAARTRPSIVYAGDSVIYVTWQDTRNGSPYYTIYSSKINSLGARQWTYDFMAADNFKSIQTDPYTLIDPEGKAITLWGDNREQADDATVDPEHTDEIFGSRYSDMEDIARTGVPVIVTSVKVIGTTATGVGIPKYSRTFTSDGTGNININDTNGGLEWGDYMFSVPESSGYCLESTNPPFPLPVYPGQQAYIVIDVCP